MKYDPSVSEVSSSFLASFLSSLSLSVCLLLRVTLCLIVNLYIIHHQPCNISTPVPLCFSQWYITHSPPLRIDCSKLWCLCCFSLSNLYFVKLQILVSLTLATQHVSPQTTHHSSPHVSSYTPRSASPAHSPESSLVIKSTTAQSAVPCPHHPANHHSLPATTLI